MSLPSIFALLIGLTTLVFSLERAMRRIKDARQRVKGLSQKKTAQVERIKKIAYETLHLKRELRQLTNADDDIQLECRRLEEELRIVSQPSNRTFVLDERRTPADDCWIISVAAPEPEAGHPRLPWYGTRRFLVWAMDEAAARAKVERKYALDKGYGIVGARVKEPADTNGLPSQKPRRTASA